MIRINKLKFAGLGRGKVWWELSPRRGRDRDREKEKEKGKKDIKLKKNMTARFKSNGQNDLVCRIRRQILRVPTHLKINPHAPPHSPLHFSHYTPVKGSRERTHLAFGPTLTPSLQIWS